MHHDEPLSEELVSVLRESADHYAFMGETRGLAGVMAALQELLSSSSPEAKRQAGELLRDLLDLASLRKSQVLLQSLTATIHRCFLAETDPTSVGKLIECAGEAISVAVKLGEYGIAETLVWELRGGDSATCNAGVHLHIVLEKVCRIEALDILIDGLHSNDVARRDGAANLSKDLKQDIRTALSHPHPRVRAHAVNMLSGVPEGWAYEMLFDLAVSGDTPVACEAIKAQHRGLLSEWRRQAPRRKSPWADTEYW